LKKYFFTIILLLFIIACPIFFVPATYADQIKGSSLDLGVSYRVDQLDWSIAGNTSGGNPNIQSELTWKDLKIAELDLDWSLEVVRSKSARFNRVVKTHIGFGRSLSGSRQDSDYLGDNRTQEWSRSSADSKVQTLDLSAAVGWKFALENDKFSLTPLLGYSYHRQDLHDTNGYQVISDKGLVAALFGPSAVATALGPITGLDSTYAARWNGPWVGLDSNCSITEKLQLSGGIEYHLATYVGKADWNLRDEFVHPLSFEHKARGDGILLKLAAGYSFSDHWSLLLSGNYQIWQTEHGSDRTYFAAGGTGITRLNAVNWESYAVKTGISYRF